MIKKIIVSFCLFLSMISYAQQGTSSPYSFYGIGDIRFKGTVENRSMGGMSVFPDSIHVNLQNPALLSGIKLTSFVVGGTLNKANLTTSTQSEKNQRVTLDYLSVAIPTNKIGIGFGLIPYSSVGYKIKNVSSDLLTATIYNGNGGVNKVYSSFSYKINEKFSVGIDLQYNFGNIETTSVKSQLGVELNSRELNTSSVSGLNINTGIAFQSKINKKLNFFSSLTYAPQANLTLKNTRNIATVLFNSLGAETVVDNVDIDVANTKFKLPSKFTFGSGIGEVRKWLVGAEITLQDNSNYANRFEDITQATFENATKISVGGYFIPKYNSYSEFWKRVTYRGGFRFENTGLVIYNESIKENAVTLGFGLPLGGTFSNINFGFELGKRGTKNAGLVQENFGNFSIGLSFNDKWFVKRKFD